MLEKCPEDITFDDIERLVTLYQPEGYQLDYKVSLNLQDREAKKEFLRDVTSLANTYGGYLIIGIEEEKGVPTGNIPGLIVNNLDDFKLKVESVIRDNIEPRLFAHTLRAFELNPGVYIIAIHVSRSWNPPHRPNNDQFYARSSAGKFPLSVEQLRRVFTQGAETLERTRRFFRERIYSIHSGDGPVQMSASTPKVILHVAPLASFEGRVNLPVGRQLLDSLGTQIRPFTDPNGWNPGYNAHGLIWAFQRTEQGLTTGFYTQLLRNGIFEGAENYRIRAASSADGVQQIIPATYIERETCKAVARYLWALQHLKIEPPVIVSLCLAGIRGYSIQHSMRFLTQPEPLTVDPLLLPEVTIEDFSGVASSEASLAVQINIALKLKPAFDTLWQAFGFEGSVNYSDQSWNPRE